MIVLLLAWLWMLPVSLLAPPRPTARPAQVARGERQAVPFRFVDATGAAHSVAVAGTFNGWNKNANPLTKAPDGNTWTTTLPLEPGVYQYKFVLDDATWQADSAAPVFDDGNGNRNSLLTVRPHGYDTRPGVIGDGLITGSAVRHAPISRDVARLDARHVRLTLRTRRDDVRAGALILFENGRRRELPLVRRNQDALFDYWRAVAPLPARGPLRYAFRLQDGPSPRWYDARDWLVTPTFTPQWFVLDPARFPVFAVPDWARDAVFYQIFPDRFANGDPTNDGSNPIPWGGPPDSSRYMGGDLKGVLQHFDYLRDLGVNALYFNPLFAARSSHGYDTTDYHRVDPHYGDNDQFRALVEKAHQRGWRVILDGVFNHTGVDFAGFRSLQTDGENSPYRQWYFVRGFPIEVRNGQTNYVGWFGTPWMPKLNVANPDTRRYLLDVGTRWITDAHIDGWRLDAADEVKPDFWQDFRKAVRRADPNAYLVGEIWGDAGAWLQGDQFDAAMNYRWRGAALDFFVFDKAAPSAFDARLARIRDDYPPAATSVMFNMLGSHDTERLRTLCRNDRDRERQAVLFQMTYPGVPNIYYGDEIGLEGGRDPDNRRGMEWDATQQDAQTLTFYRDLLRLRRDHPALRRGEYKTLVADDKTGVFGFARVHPKETVYVFFNRSDKPQAATLTLPPGSLLSIHYGDNLTLDRDHARLRLGLPKFGAAVLGVAKPVAPKG